MKKPRNTPADSTQAGDAWSNSAWANPVELNTKRLRSTASKAGLHAGRDALKLSLENIDRRRIQIWALTLIMLFLIFLTMALVTGDFGFELPAWLPEKYLKIGIFVLVILYGLYVIEKEYQLRVLSRFLVDEQFQHDVLNRRLKVVETLLESSKAINQGVDEQRALDVIIRQATLFTEDNDVCVYLKKSTGVIVAVAGNRNQGLHDLARAVIGRNQSQYSRSSTESGVFQFGVPISQRGGVLGALCLRTSKQGIDTFETLMVLALFAEQASAAIANTRLREQLSIQDSQRVYSSNRDTITGLLTRTAFTAELKSRLAAYSDRSPNVAVMFIDIDGLQRINSSMGYGVGDAVVKHFASALQGLTPSSGIIGHFGADEFMVALFDISGYAEASDAARTMRAGLSDPLLVGGRKLRITASFGLAMPETFEVDAGELVRNAQMAMQEAKRRGGNGVATFDSSLVEDLDRSLDLEDELRKALDNDEIGITLQPIFDLDTMQPVAVETLVRWMHPEQGLIPANAFLPFAERTGQLKEIDQRTIQKSCAAVRALRDRGFELPVHLNLFPGYVSSPDLVPALRRILETTGVDARSFVLEVSEDNPQLLDESTVGNLVALKKAGFRIALEDFGTGSRSIESLNVLPVDGVKLNRSFIQNLGTGDGSRKQVVESLASIAERMNLEIIAVGIENDRQVELLRDSGCGYGQGFFLVKPVPLKSFLDYYKPAEEQTSA